MTSLSLAVGVGLVCALLPAFATNLAFLFKHRGAVAARRRHAPSARSAIDLFRSVVILNGEERPLRQGDFLHCPAGIEHVFVGAGDGPCTVLMIGSRREVAAHYPVNELAAKYDASVTKATDEPAEAYSDWRREPRRATPNPWPLQ